MVVHGFDGVTWCPTMVRLSLLRHHTLSSSVVDDRSGLRSPTKMGSENWFRGSKGRTNTCKLEDPQISRWNRRLPDIRH